MDKHRIRIGVSGHDLKFWMPLQQALEATGDYEFRHDVWSGHETHDANTSSALIAWADVLVAEWALGNAIYYSRHKRPGQRLFVRLHAQERRTEYPSRIDYENVDRVIFVSRHIQGECVEKFGMPAEKCQVIGNFVDVDKYALPKMGGSEHTLGIIGTAPSGKRLDLAVDTLELLLRRDDRYQLRVKGSSPAEIPWLWARAAERRYYEALYARINRSALRYKIIFDPRGKDVHRWLQMVGTILSPSDAESFHMAVAEGAASGALPVVWSWPGAAEVYPEFDRVNDAHEAADCIEFYARSAAGARFRRQAAQILRQRYDGTKVAALWQALLEEGVGQQAGRKPEPAHAAAKKSLVVVWAIDGWQRFHRKEMLQELARHLADTHDLLVIEPGNHFETVLRLAMDTPENLRHSLAGQLLSEGANIFRTRLFTGGVPPGAEKALYQGGAQDPLVVLDRLVKHHFGTKRSVLHWVYKPDQALRLRAQDRFVYEVYDDYTMNFGTGVVHQATADAEPLAIERAEHVFFTSEPLYERKAGRARAASLVGNGVAYEVFARYRLGEFEASGRPAAGYLGNLSAFFDWGLMLEVCKGLPDIDFVFHGPTELPDGDARLATRQQMAELPNVRFTGRVSRESGAAAVNRYDVLLIPFVVNEAMHAVNPLKLWEYYAAGRPVVMTPMDAVAENPPEAIVVEGVTDWIDAIGRCLSSEIAGPDVVASRVSRAEAHRWEVLTANHARVLKELDGYSEDGNGRPAGEPLRNGSLN